MYMGTIIFVLSFKTIKNELNNTMVYFPARRHVDTKLINWSNAPVTY